MSSRSESTHRTSQKSGKEGRSAATGKFVLTPASKGSSVTVKEASKAAKTLSGGYQKKK